MIERLSLHKQVFDLNTTSLGQWCVSEVLRRNLFEEHLAHLRIRYKEKRDLMRAAIARHFPPEVRVTMPEGGFSLWCRLPGDLRARTLLREAVNDHVAFVIGEPFHVDGGGQQQFRLNYAYPPDDDIEEAIKRIGKAIRRLLARRSINEEERNARSEHLPIV